MSGRNTTPEEGLSTMYRPSHRWSCSPTVTTYSSALDWGNGVGSLGPQDLTDPGTVDEGDDSGPRGTTHDPEVKREVGGSRRRRRVREW